MSARKAMALHRRSGSDDNDDVVDASSSSSVSSWSSSADSPSPFDSHGILEHALSYLVRPPRMIDVLSASLTSKRWSEAARCDELWRDAARRLWSTKVGMPRPFLPLSDVARMEEREEEEEDDGSESRFRLPLFHNTIFTEASLSRLTANDVRDLFSNRPSYGRRRSVASTAKKLVNRIDDDDVNVESLRDDVRRCMPDRLGGETTHASSMTDDDHRRTTATTNKTLTKGFDDLWFGSYVCSLIDSKRTTMSIDELCDPDGYDVHFKLSSVVGFPFDEDDFFDYEYEYELERDDEFDDDESAGEYVARGGGGGVERGGGGGAGGRRREAADDVDLGEHELRPYGDGSSGIKLLFHASCTFKENGEFQMDPTDEGSYRPDDLKWRWMTDEDGDEEGGRTGVQVGPYPPLEASRTEDDWGWKLENLHVVLFRRGGREGRRRAATVPTEGRGAGTF